jgi:hypothetical protein
MLHNCMRTSYKPPHPKKKNVSTTQHGTRVSLMNMSHATCLQSIVLLITTRVNHVLAAARPILSDFWVAVAGCHVLDH